MRRVLESAAAMLPMKLRTSSVKIELAELILNSAAAGERDPIGCSDEPLQTIPDP
jgi:hypothetical protein